MIFISIFIFSILIAVSISIKGYKHNKNIVYLSIFIVLLSIYEIAHYFVLINQSIQWAAITYINFTPLYLLLGPLLYFYVRGSLVQNGAFKKKDLVHFIPAVIDLIGIAAYLFSPFEFKKETIRLMFEDLTTFKTMDFHSIYKPNVSFVLRIGLLVIYTLNNLWFIRSFYKKKKLDDAFATTEKKNSIRWIVLFHILVLSMALSYTIFVLNIYADQIFSTLNSIVTSIAGLSILLMSLSLLLFPKLAKNISNLYYKKPDPDQLFTNNPYYIELKERIDTYFKKHKPCTNKKFSRKDLAKALKVPDHHITHCFTYVFKMSFPAYKNIHKVNHLKELLNESDEHQKVDKLYSEVGFSSKSLMYSVFKEHTGMTPKQYQHSVQNQS